MRDPRDDAAFTGFVCAVAPPLLRTAWLLTGEARAAEDLLRSTLTTAYRAWPRWAAGSDREAAVLRLLAVEHLRGRRAGGAGSAVLDEPLAPPDARTSARRTEVTRLALARLPARTRTVLVLRLADDLDEAATARTMGVRRRSVRDELARALAAMPAPDDPAAAREADLRERLADLGDDLLPDDPLRYAEAARATGEHRRGRLAVAAAVLVLLAVVAVPLAFRLISTAAPSGATAPVATGAPAPTAASPTAAATLAAPLDPATHPAVAELTTRFGVAGAAYGFLQNCLFGSGIQITVHPDGSFDTTPRPGRDGPDSALVSSCFDRLARTVPLSEDARRLLVTDWTDTYLCLVVRGWETARQPPAGLSLEHGLLTWNPYEGIDPLELGAARSTCPVRTY